MSHKDWCARAKTADGIQEQADRLSLKAMALRLKTEGTVFELDWKTWVQILDDYSRCCALCGESKLGLKPSHINVRARDLGYRKHNVIPVCPVCINKPLIGSKAREQDNLN